MEGRYNLSSLEAGGLREAEWAMTWSPALHLTALSPSLLRGVIDFAPGNTYIFSL